MTYEKLNGENFDERSLDGFIRRQEVSEVWRMAGGRWTLIPVDYAEDWDRSERGEQTGQIIRGLAEGSFAYGAFDEGALVGFVLVNPERLGSRGQYMDLEKFHVSAPYRGRGIGKKLFQMACAEALARGAEKLYISANSSKKTQAVYRRLGCVPAEEILPYYAEHEPYDVQMEFVL